MLESCLNSCFVVHYQHEKHLCFNHLSQLLHHGSQTSDEVELDLHWNIWPSQTSGRNGLVHVTISTLKVVLVFPCVLLYPILRMHSNGFFHGLYISLPPFPFSNFAIFASIPLTLPRLPATILQYLVMKRGVLMSFPCWVFNVVLWTVSVTSFWSILLELFLEAFYNSFYCVSFSILVIIYLVNMDLCYICVLSISYGFELIDALRVCFNAFPL